MSSTAIVLKLLSDRSQSGTQAGRISISVLLLQDLFVIVAMLAVPLLAASAGVSAPANHQNTSHQSTQPLIENPFLAVLVGFSIVVGVLLAGRQFIPKVLHEVVRLRNRELFLITLVLICLGTAAITAAAGLSLAIGAFIAGLALSESEYGHQAFAEVLPFRDTLASLFFVSVGMPRRFCNRVTQGFCHSNPGDACRFSCPDEPYCWWDDRSSRRILIRSWITRS